MKYLLPWLAVIGLGIATVVLIIEHRPTSQNPPLARTPAAPFESYVAGTGILEGSTENVAVGTPVAGIVSKIFVKWGDRVKAGDPLFGIDDRDQQARLVSAAALVQEAEAALSKAKHDWERLEPLQNTGASSIVEIRNARDDVAIAAAALDVARAHVGEVTTEIERRIIRAPVTGRILRINVRLGELAPSDGTAGALMLLGDDDRLHLRTEVDENDAWRVRPNAKAVAFPRGNPKLAIPVQFVRVEPYVLPKTVLTGSGTERTDVRVLQVIYGFDHASLPVYVGEEMDVFIEAPPHVSGGR